MKGLIVLALTLTYTGCERPVDHPINSACIWVENDNRTLDLASPADRRHLRYDAITAEDVAIRWADQNFHLLPEWDLRREQCMEKLFNGVARNHAVDAGLVRQYHLKRDVPLDSVVILAFGALYAFVAYYIAGRVSYLHPPPESTFWIMIFTIGVGFGLAGTLAGMLWSIAIEELILGSGHLSYRMNQIPMRQYWPIAFVCSIVVFALAAIVRSRIPIRPKREISLGLGIELRKTLLPRD